MLAGLFPATRTNSPPFVAALPPGRAHHHPGVAAFRQGTPDSSANLTKSAPKFPSTLPAVNVPALRATHLHSSKKTQAGSKTPTHLNTAREPSSQITRASWDTEDSAPATLGIYGVNITALQSRSYRETSAAADSPPIPETCWKLPAKPPHKPWPATSPTKKESSAAPIPATAFH